VLRDRVSIETPSVHYLASETIPFSFDQPADESPSSLLTNYATAMPFQRRLKVSAQRIVG
jgi:hypothetical protein